MEKSGLHRFFRKLFDHGVEARGIERVPEEERDGTHTIGLLLLWWSVNSVVSTVPIGLLAQPFYGLSFKSAVACIVTFTAIGAACCGFIATLGPKTGLRTMVISRYSVGFVGATIFAIFNILTQLGFSCTAVILGGQTLTNVSNGKLPLEASIVLVGFTALILCFVGYNAVHYWERYAWIVLMVFYCCIWALAAKQGFDFTAQEALQPTGLAYAGGFLSFGGIVFSSSAGWAPICADFCCRLPHRISGVKVFFLTWFGLMVPLVFLETMSAALMTVPAYANAFGADGDVGAVLSQVFEPWGGGGKFILVILAFSIICNCTPNTYSAALSAQTLFPWFEKIPRALWCVVMFVIYTVAAVAGREHFSTLLSNFLSILGYWIAFFIVVVAEEHYIFRSWIIDEGYDLDVYDSITELPVGIAGIFACCCGAGLAAVSMAQVWYIGPLGKVFGEYGGDLGFEMSAAATAIVYPPLRYLEYRIFDR
ncbi:cytosine-purine permease [Kockovaella imperatae]|uniref:Cytosine-purine permease n=1 Tax=Kockovaella imperatae TaxID=4999 RepID=A0A1Y1UHK4_9TREE|nr:cytosine-purine permease [Kockovaella imperatae]ORX37540.1 cytosine-purine permease [Kockovaella imperatae]